MGEHAESRRYLCIGDLVLDTATHELWRGGDRIGLPPLSYRLLELLAERAPDLVTQEDIAALVWKDRVVSPETVTQRIKLLRQSLGDDARDPRYIALVRGQGYRLTAEVRPQDAPQSRQIPQPPRGSRRPRIALAVLALAAIGASALAYIPRVLNDGADNDLRSADRIALEKSIAVLPFDDMSVDGGQSYLGDGIADELLHRLSQSDKLRVIARTSSFALRDPGLDIPAIAARLGARYVLQGSVRESDGGVRITAQLVDAHENTQMWSEAYERSADDAITVQREIAASLGDLLEIELAAGDGKIDSPAAYERFLKGRFYYNRRAEGDLERAERAFTDALGIEPNLPRAWTGLAAIYNVRVWTGQLDKATGLRKQRAALEHALALDPDSAIAHARLARLYRVEGKWEDADRHFQHAWELDRNDPTVLVLRAGWLSFHGRLEESIELQRRAIALDPLAATYHHNLGFGLLAAGRPDEAEEEFEKAMSLSGAPRTEYAHSFAVARLLRAEFEGALALVSQMEAVEDRIAVQAMAAHALGRSENADELVAELAALDNPRSMIRLAEVHGYRGNPGAVFDALDRLEAIIGQRHGVLPEVGDALWELRSSPFLGHLRSDSELIERFSEIFRRYYTAV